jgi:formylglycine-generating enzyme required for sulfatase activity
MSPYLCRAFTTAAAVIAGFALPGHAGTRDLRVDGKPPAQYVTEQGGRTMAVVIGINEYRDPKVPRLKYAVADAKAVGAELEARDYQVTYLLNEQATRRGIETELRSRLPRRVGKHDRVVIYYAGHGQDVTVEGGKRMGYLLPADGELDEVPGTGISMGTIRELSDALPAKHVLFLMDSCYGGIAGEQTRALPKMTEAYLREITRNPGRQLITAGGADQEALEASDGGHGLFTYYLLKGLQEGLADLDEDGLIRTTELFTYLDGRVFKDAQMKGHRQKPELWNLSPDKGEFVFFTTRTAPEKSAPLAAAPAAPPAIKDVDTRGYDAYEAIARLAAKRDQAWSKVKAFAASTGVKRETRVAALDKFLIDFPDDNPHAAEVEMLKQQIGQERQEVQVAKAPAPTYSVPKAGGREVTGKDGAPMVLIAAGEFMMGAADGDSDEQPAHRVRLDAYYLDVYEVTTALFGKFMQAAGHAEPSYWPLLRQISGDDRPVMGVDWNDADAYCRYYGKRLPTEAEWEKAARGTDGRTYPWGNKEPTNTLANFGQQWAPNINYYIDRIVPVGRYEGGKSPYGVHDMAGNVSEWTADWYDKRYYAGSPADNPRGASGGSQKVLRGGSWGNDPQHVRATYRHNAPPSNRNARFGFRCAQDRAP